MSLPSLTAGPVSSGTPFKLSSPAGELAAELCSGLASSIAVDRTPKESAISNQRPGMCT
ncbi:hypothetical protein [Calycomorphotria hydatis]|uniref:hypothetical protein n=1 Tax=Calycomorphotria hydatis TaxID=2528027 RepID=UPI0018D26CC9|nr:hypothetical protein [Calycomorphotria hydatis]